MALKPHLFVPIPITLKFDCHIIGRATGFLYRFMGKIYLVSNWHVLSGRNPFDGQPLRADGALPNNLDVILHRVRFSKSLPRQYVSSDKRTFDLNKVKFLQHPSYGQDVDVACIFIKTGLELDFGTEVICINDVKDSTNVANSVGDDVFILGFPLKNENTNNFAIWKRGSIATEYSFKYKEKHIFLVDSLTKDGMSGSPVVFISNYFSMPDGNMGISSTPMIKFLGVYSGREPSIEGSVPQLGLVWKSIYIEEIINGNVTGSSKEFGPC